VPIFLELVAVCAKRMFKYPAAVDGGAYRRSLSIGTARRWLISLKHGRPDLLFEGARLPVQIGIFGIVGQSRRSHVWVDAILCFPISGMIDTSLSRHIAIDHANRQY